MELVTEEFLHTTGYIVGIFILALGIILFFPTLGWSYRWSKSFAQWQNEIGWTEWKW